ncbi:ATP-binding protein [Denitrobaculum tricleocarpae]|uniref:histidine kinase n=1 Tax=Denitrobaculum tricleocarpae TaxID=2591009 RepID=A0A545TX32_9PROT|nr:ATP-binding protein [Denitrobaculum tricleocarpae]TQV81779.1 response regulator [Denitrobaculum tricleocarpae]
METLKTLIRTHEDWLVDRVLGYAHKDGYTKYSSTLREPWRESICVFSKPLFELLDQAGTSKDLPGSIGENDEPMTAFAIEEARLHRQRGVPLSLFIGLTKSYRKAYIDLIIDQNYPKETEEKYWLFIERFFDYIEVAFCTRWTELPEDAALQELEAKNRALTNEKNKYLTIFESLNDPVVLLNDNGKVENLNNAAAVLFGGAGIPGEGYYARENYSLLDRQIGALIGQPEQHYRIERRMETIHGPRTFDIKARRMLDVSKKFIGTVLILSDVTEYQTAKRQADAANAAKSAFLATMSHEIRTPISGILGISHLLRDEKLTSDQKNYIEALAASGQVLIDLVDDVLDYSKIEADAIELNTVDFDLRDTVTQVAGLMTLPAERKGLQLTCSIDTALPSQIIGDQAKIRRVLLNLTSNAVKFTSSGSVTLAVEALDGDLLFTVTDTGPGVPEDMGQTIFQPFVQNAGQIGGSGLGLAISRKLIDIVGGDIGFESQEGKGSKFWFKVPLIIAPDQSPRLVENTTTPSIRPLRILLVEDNPVNLMFTRAFLERDGHSLQLATSGEEALDIFHCEQIDLVLMDIRMDGMGGIEAISLMKANEDADKANTPILVLTADLARTEEAICIESGADAVLGKPFTPSMLQQAIAQCISSNSRITCAADRTRALQNAVFDETLVRQHKAMLGADDTRKIIETFEAFALSTIAAIQTAVELHDNARVSHLAHSLKSSAGSIGLMRLKNAAESLQKLAERADQEKLPAGLAGLLSARDRAFAALRGSDLVRSLSSAPPQEV